ncbi:MAG: outer membrane beta-barrel protein [Roseibium album]|uniref:outer membrane beta-barrel protein n=1 Tax=Roseibium album TaxID=311410 RepID=UPI0032EAF98E
MRTTCKFAVALTLTAAASAAVAADLRYDYLEGGYQNVDLDNPGVDGDGLFLGGSLLLAQSFFLAADFDYADFDRGVDARSIELGGGVRFPLAPSLDLVLGGGYVDVEVDTRFGDFDDDGLFLRGGVRWLATDQVELKALLNYVDLDESGDDTGVDLGVVVHLQPQLALLAGVEIADDADVVNLGLRYHFRR